MYLGLCPHIAFPSRNDYPFWLLEEETEADRKLAHADLEPAVKTGRPICGGSEYLPSSRVEARSEK